MYVQLTGLRKYLVLVGAAAIGTGATWIFRQAGGAEAPHFGNVTNTPRISGVWHSAGRAGEAWTAWFRGPDAETSARGALDLVLRSKGGPPDFTMLVFGPEANGPAVLSAARRLLGARTRVFGLNSHIPAILDSSSIAASIPGGSTVAVLAVRSRAVTFGVGAAEVGPNLPAREAAREAVRRAIQDAGRTLRDPPQAILLAPPSGVEEDTIAGIEDVVGRSIPVLGGTPGPQGFVIGGDVASARAVSLALIYTRLTVGWTFEAGYDVSVPKSGIVTKMAGRQIVEIDHRPAWEVYDEWLEGRLTDAFANNVNEAGRLLALNPCYRQFKAPGGQVFAVFSHPWPRKSGDGWALAVSTSIKAGERIHLSHGTWELLMNRVATLPRAAKARGGIEADEKPLFGIGFLCAGVAGVLPPAEAAKLPMLMSYGMSGAPFLLAVTSGEQGFLPGIGNKHANLSTGFLAVRDAQ